MKISGEYAGSGTCPHSCTAADVKVVRAESKTPSWLLYASSPAPPDRTTGWILGRKAQWTCEYFSSLIIQRGKESRKCIFHTQVYTFVFETMERDGDTLDLMNKVLGGRISGSIILSCFKRILSPFPCAASALLLNGIRGSDLRVQFWILTDDLYGILYFDAHDLKFSGLS